MGYAPDTTDSIRQCRRESTRGIDTPDPGGPRAGQTRYRRATPRIKHGREEVSPQKSGGAAEPLEQGVERGRTFLKGLPPGKAKVIGGKAARGAGPVVLPGGSWGRGAPRTRPPGQSAKTAWRFRSMSFAGHFVTRLPTSLSQSGAGSARGRGERCAWLRSRGSRATSVSPLDHAPVRRGAGWRFALFFLGASRFF